MAIAVIYPRAPTVSLHAALLLYSASSSCLSAFILSLNQTEKPEPFTALFSLIFWVSLSPCVAICSPKTLHHQSRGLSLLLFPNILPSLPPHFSLP